MSASFMQLRGRTGFAWGRHAHLRVVPEVKVKALAKGPPLGRWDHLKTMYFSFPESSLHLCSPY